MKFNNLLMSILLLYFIRYRPVEVIPVGAAGPRCGERRSDLPRQDEVGARL